jgi:predicted DNA-binding ribbon-helix-helix protein
MKVLVNLEPQQIEFVDKVAKCISDPRAKFGNFSKAIRFIVEEYKRLEGKKYG